LEAADGVRHGGPRCDAQRQLIDRRGRIEDLEGGHQHSGAVPASSPERIRGRHDRNSDDYSQRTRGVGLTRERDGVAEGGVHLPGRYGAESDLIRTRGEPATEDGWQQGAPLGVDTDQIDVLVPYAGARGRHEGGSDDSGLVLPRDRSERLLLSGVDE